MRLRRSSSHDGCTDEEDERRNEETFLASHEVTERVTQESTEESTCLVSGNQLPDVLALSLPKLLVKEGSASVPPTKRNRNRS